MKSFTTILASLVIVLMFYGISLAGINAGLLVGYPFNENANDRNGFGTNGQKYGYPLLSF